jgi:lipopolysaccharide transport system ATP-binding protein
MGALTAIDLGKAYRSYRRPIDSLKELVTGRAYAETLWAVRGVNLDVPVGGSLGIVGDNGAGKSTLLRLLAGATKATEGRVHRGGRTAAILSLGAGFHADLTGAENIRIGCAVLGLSPEETDALEPAIVDFSELGPFMDKPLKSYSSGMYLRLGVSVATAINPEIVIVDEHLSVGDQHFRHKCLRRIMALREAGCSLVFCSHDLYSVEEVCDRTLWIRDGRASMLGPTADVLAVYQDYVRAQDRASDLGREAAPPAAADATTGDNRILDVQVHGDRGDALFETGDRLDLHIRAKLTPAAVRDGVHVALVIVRNDGLWCYGVKSPDSDRSCQFAPTPSGAYAMSFVIPRLPLLAGKYSFTVGLMDDRSPHAYDHRTMAASFTVRQTSDDVGVVKIDHVWQQT